MGKGDNSGPVSLSFISSYEPPHGKTNNLHRRKQRRRSASRKLISTFVFATRIVKFLPYLTPKFQASSLLLKLYRPVCVRPVRKAHCWFSHETAHIKSCRFSLESLDLVILVRVQTKVAIFYPQKWLSFTHKSGYLFLDYLSIPCNVSILV